MKFLQTIFFDSEDKESSFITFTNIDTQFGREIVFNIDYYNEELILKLWREYYHFLLFYQLW